VTKPAEKLFSHCVGPARRGMPPMSPKTFANPIYDETNAFWDLKLENTPEAITRFAGEVADQAILIAEEILDRSDVPDLSRKHLGGLIEQAKSQFQQGKQLESDAQANGSIYLWAKATRSYTRAQIKARQVINTLQPPPASPEEVLSTGKNRS
ncbi:MAG: hypothetical protein ACK2T7_12555, partial [Anaerolineales bacterium]